MALEGMRPLEVDLLQPRLIVVPTQDPSRKIELLFMKPQNRLGERSSFLACMGHEGPLSSIGSSGGEGLTMRPADGTRRHMPARPCRREKIVRRRIGTSAGLHRRLSVGADESKHMSGTRFDDRA